MRELDAPQNIISTFRHFTNNNKAFANENRSALIIDNDGNSYPFQYSHHSDLLSGRPFPNYPEECPNGLQVDRNTGECMNRCSASTDCPMGYKCKNGSCEREMCSNGDPCSSGMCSHGVCQPIRCGELNPVFISMSFPHGDLVPMSSANANVCVNTPHHNLTRRFEIPDLSRDPRYSGMF